MSIKKNAYSKVDFLMTYGVSMPVFESWIEPIMTEIGWIKGERQKFPPKVIQRVFDYLGDPDE